MIRKTAALLFTLLMLLTLPAAAVDASKLLPPEQAFVPQIQASADGLDIRFNIADGYYLYRDKIEIRLTPQQHAGKPVFSPGDLKKDDFFGEQTVYHRSAHITLPFQSARPAKYTLTLFYQGCAEAGVCYPPVENRFDITADGTYRPEGFDNSPAGMFLEPAAPASGTPSAVPDSSGFTLSWETLNANLLAFFVAGLGLSFTACMYPLIPIVSGIVVGGRHTGKGRAFLLTFIYTQGLALTYALAGAAAGRAGALLTVWLQQPWVVLCAAGILAALALSMFGVFNLQMPAAMQSYFQNQSNRLPGGRAFSVFVMGAFSALIIGPCVTPPLAAALGYIGKTGDSLLGGLALYALALGTGVPLMLIGTFGAHILPKAGSWMNGVKCAFGFLLLAAAVYIATPFLPYAASVSLYCLLLAAAAVLLITSGRLKAVPLLAAALLLAGCAWFGIQSLRGQTTPLHDFLSLHRKSDNPRRFTSVSDVKAAMNRALKARPDLPVLLDFYADWCVSCKEMEAHTLHSPEVAAVIPQERFFTVDVTAGTPEHRALLKEYGLFGPPGIFVLKADGSRSEVLPGFVKPEEFVAWYQKNR